MAVTARPLARQDLLDSAVVEADAWTALQYLRHREQTPRLPEMEEAGRKALPNIEGALFDCYTSLWQPEPVIREEVKPAQRFWQGILGQAMETSAYQELHAGTQLDSLLSVIGTLAMGQSVIAMVSKDDQEKLQELQQAQEQADAANDQAQQADAQAQAIAEMAAEAGAQAAGQGAPSDLSGGQPGQGQTPSSAQGATDGTQGQSQPGSQGQPSSAPSGATAGKGQMTLAQAQALADALAKQAAQAQTEVKMTREAADEATLAAEIKAEELLGQPGTQAAADKQRELARMGLQAVKDAQGKVQEVSGTIEAWGLETAELQQQSIPEAMGLLERMRKSEALRKFAQILGRLRAIAAKKAKSQIQGEGVRMTVPETGRDIRRAHRSELVALTNPATRAQALRRWAQGELRLVGEKTKQKLGRGPVVVCEDASGSMDGVKQQWAKAVVLSLAHFAKLTRRSFGWVMFDYSVKKHATYPGGVISAKQMLEIAEAHSGGGTDFERPLRQAIEMIEKEGLKKADILLVTDGECAVSAKFLSELAAKKKALEFSIFAILCDVGSTSDATLRQFADRIERVSAFTPETAEKQVFGLL